MDLDHLRRLRLRELDAVLSHIPSDARVLELGAGAGWQAQCLAERGCDVTALDIEDEASDYVEDRAWPVVSYDGRAIPFAEDTFDVVFSSNVLEHVVDLATTQSELARVLRPGGVAVHVLPSSTWRLWTLAAHYIHVPRELARRVTKRGAPGGTDAPRAGRNRTLPWLVREAVWPHPHGERGNALTEAAYFTRYRWLRELQLGGWTVVEHRPTHLFYTGHSLLGRHLGLRARQRLSYVLGSACMIYVLEPPS